MKYRAYLFEYEPPGLALTEASAEAMMEESDFCIFAPAGIPIGMSIRLVEEILPGTGGKCPRTGSSLRCVAHDHGGKVVVLEETSS
jgi:hypothetical protein